MGFTAAGAYIPDGSPYGGGSFNFSSTGASTGSQPSQYKPQQPAYGATVGGASPGRGIANGAYANPLDLQQAENQFRTQQRGFDNQQKMAQMGYEHQSGMAQAQRDFEAQRAAQAQQAAQSLMTQFQGQWGGAQAQMPQFQPIQMQTPGREAPLQMPDNQAANAAGFARAKDQAGQVAASALSGLRSSLGGRGLLGSGAEYRGAANITQKGMGQLGEVTRDQAIKNADLSNQNAAANYQGNITQRAQDMQAAQQVAGFNADQQARAADWQMKQQQFQFDQQRQMMEMALSALRY